MTKWLRDYWLEVVTFGAILAVYLINQAPDMTWINTDNDGVHYVYASKYLYVAHKGGAPLYILLGRLFLYIPFGTEFWKMSLISVISGFVGSMMIYLIIKHYLADRPQRRLYAVLGSLIYGGSSIVISQSIIVESYPLVMTFALLGFYCVLKKRYMWATIMYGLGVAVHPIIVFSILPVVIFNKDLRRVKYLLVFLSFGVFYVYNYAVAAFNPPPSDMWSNLTVKSSLNDIISTGLFLSGGLAIYDLPKRLLDTIGLLGVSMGFAFIVLLMYLVKVKKLWKNQLFWLFIIPLVYFVCDLAIQTYVYLISAIAYGAIIVAVYLVDMKRYWTVLVSVSVIGLFVFNAYYFDIGRTLDPELSAKKFYNEELAKVPDGDILMPQYGWEWAMIHSYNKNENRNIIPVCMDIVVSPKYRDVLNGQGVKFEDAGVATRMTLIETQNAVATSIVRMNDNVWITIQTEPRTYGAEVVMADGDESLVKKIPLEEPGQIHWKPSNPYDIITGAIEVTDWNFVTLSNHTVALYIGLASIGLILNWLIFILPQKRKTEEENRR